MSVSTVHLLHRNTWEAFYHRLGVPVLGMFLETDVVQKGIRYVTPGGTRGRQRTLEPWSSPATTMLLRITTMEGNTKEAHKGLLTDRADDILGHFVRLGLALGCLWPILGLAFAFLLGLSTLYAVSTGKHVEDW